MTLDHLETLIAFIVFVTPVFIMFLSSGSKFKNWMQAVKDDLNVKIITMSWLVHYSLILLANLFVLIIAGPHAPIGLDLFSFEGHLISDTLIYETSKLAIFTLMFHAAIWFTVVFKANKDRQTPCYQAFLFDLTKTKLGARISRKLLN